MDWILPGSTTEEDEDDSESVESVRRSGMTKSPFSSPHDKDSEQQVESDLHTPRTLSLDFDSSNTSSCSSAVIFSSPRTSNRNTFTMNKKPHLPLDYHFKPFDFEKSESCDATLAENEVDRFLFAQKNQKNSTEASELLQSLDLDSVQTRPPIPAFEIRLKKSSSKNKPSKLQVKAKEGGVDVGAQMMPGPPLHLRTGGSTFPNAARAQSDREKTLYKFVDPIMPFTKQEAEDRQRPRSPLSRFPFRTPQRRHKRKMIAGVVKEIVADIVENYCRGRRQVGEEMSSSSGSSSVEEVAVTKEDREAGGREDVGARTYFSKQDHDESASWSLVDEEARKAAAPEQTLSTVTAAAEGLARRIPQIVNRNLILQTTVDGNRNRNTSTAAANTTKLLDLATVNFDYLCGLPENMKGEDAHLADDEHMSQAATATELLRREGAETLFRQILAATVQSQGGEQAEDLHEHGLRTRHDMMSKGSTKIAVSPEDDHVALSSGTAAGDPDQGAGDTNKKVRKFVKEVVKNTNFADFDPQWKYPFFVMRRSQEDEEEHDDGTHAAPVENEDSGSGYFRESRNGEGADNRDDATYEKSNTTTTLALLETTKNHSASSSSSKVGGALSSATVSSASASRSSTGSASKSGESTTSSSSSSTTHVERNHSQYQPNHFKNRLQDAVLVKVDNSKIKTVWSLIDAFDVGSRKREMTRSSAVQEPEAEQSQCKNSGQERPPGEDHTDSTIGKPLPPPPRGPRFGDAAPGLVNFGRENRKAKAANNTSKSDDLLPVPKRLLAALEKSKAHSRSNYNANKKNYLQHAGGSGGNKVCGNKEVEQSEFIIRPATSTAAASSSDARVITERKAGATSFVSFFFQDGAFFSQKTRMTRS
ncbi:unnamed protein product [Amoebophrya sp. A120]|nr:unnamed protein product [Amoebophrya sp. A120]|eukprot:GSA120T00009869001.1